MFSRFTNILQSAVGAMVTTGPENQDFSEHWKSITHYFVNSKDDKSPVENSDIPGHLGAMLDILIEEEEQCETGSTGPCMEYLLHHKILETLYTLGRTDHPPGMKQYVLLFFTKLLSRIQQPLLPHVNVHRSVQKLIRICGEIKAAPTENEEIHFLCVVCAKIKSDPYLVNFFIEQPLRAGQKSSPRSPQHPEFNLVDSLLALLRSEDSRVAVKACEGLLLCASLSETASNKCLLQHTNFSRDLVEKLTILYNLLPKIMNPSDVDATEAKWGLQIQTDFLNDNYFPGKRQLLSLLSWLDYLDQMVYIATPTVAVALARNVREKFLIPTVQPAVLQTSESGSITATAVLTRCLRLVSSPILLHEFVTFILGVEREAETGSSHEHPLRRQLILRCDHLSDEVTIATLKLFEVLLLKNNEYIFHNLVLRNLLGREYKREKVQSDNTECDSTTTDSTTGDSATVDSTGDSTTIDTVDSTDDSATAGSTGDSTITTDSTGDSNAVPRGTHSGGDCVNSVNVTEPTSPDVIHDVTAGGDGARPQNVDDVTVTSGSEEALTPDASASSSSASEYSPIHKRVNSFLCLMPDEIKSSYQSEESGYDTYLTDAQRQLQDSLSQCHTFHWPLTPVCEPRYQRQQHFFEGNFLKILFDKVSRILDQCYDVNLQVTSVISRLVMIPHPNIEEYLLDQAMVSDNVRSLHGILRKVAEDAVRRTKHVNQFEHKLASSRRMLLGAGEVLNSTDDQGLINGVIILEEFCKELAAITFVKHRHQLMGDS